MTDTKLFVDSSIWVKYFIQTDELTGQLIDSHEGKLFTSVLCFHEVGRKLLRLKKNESYIKEVFKFMRENSAIIGVDEETAVKSAEKSIRLKLASMDSIIYQSAIASEALLVTADNDFHGLPNVQMVKE